MFLQQLQQHQAHMCTRKHAGMCTCLSNHTQHVKKQPQKKKKRKKMKAKNWKCKPLSEAFLTGKKKKKLKNAPFVPVGVKVAAAHEAFLSFFFWK